MRSNDSRPLPDAGHDEVDAAYRRLQRLLDIELDLTRSPERRRSLVQERFQLELAFHRLTGHVGEVELRGDDIEVVEDGDDEPARAGAGAVVFVAGSATGPWTEVAYVVGAVAALAALTALVLALLG